MRIGDRVFWAVIIFIFIGLAWLKVLERYVSIWGALIVGGAAAIAFIKYGPGTRR